MVRSMAEVGLVRFAKVAMEIAQAILPAYRTKFSKHTFTQPQLLAVSCVLCVTRTGLCVRRRFGWPSTASCETLWACTRRLTTPRSSVSWDG